MNTLLGSIPRFPRSFWRNKPSRSNGSALEMRQSLKGRESSSLSFSAKFLGVNYDLSIAY